MSNPDFDKIWGVNSSLDPYNISDTNYKKGWEFVGSMPPARVMFDYIHRFADQKMKNLNERTEALEVVNGVLIPKRKTAYSVGATGIFPGIPASWYVECTTAGTTGTTAPVITPPVTAGQTITDGSVVWTIRQCLPTSGGVMIGDIRKNSNSSSLTLYGGNGYRHGSYLNLCGNELQGDEGCFEITSGLVNSRSLQLRGEPNGALLLKLLNEGVSNTIYDLGGSAIVAKSLGTYGGYIKRASGEIIQWGRTSAGTDTEVTFPISFTSPSAVSVVAMASSANANCYTYLITSSKFHLCCSVSSTAMWIAIGF